VAELEGRAHDVQMLKFGQVRQMVRSPSRVIGIYQASFCAPPAVPAPSHPDLGVSCFGEAILPYACHAHVPVPAIIHLQIINLDLLDTIGASRGTEELKQEIKKQVRPSATAHELQQ